MKKIIRPAAAGLLVSLVSSLCAATNVQEEVAGPTGQDIKYVVSPQGGGLASVGRRGSRVAVTINGAEGPRFDDIAMPARGWVDPRPFYAVQNQTGALDRFRPRTVAFSRDGRRHAYLGRRGQDWILVVDGQETVKLPVEMSAGNVMPLGFALEFTGYEGKHIVFIRGLYEGNEMWVDGRKWPGLYVSGAGGSAGVVDPVFSPDGNRIAGVAQVSREKSTVVLDGKDTGYLAQNLTFSSDGKSLVGIAQTGNAQSIVVDGKPVARAESFPLYIVSPVGNRILAVAYERASDGSANTVLVLDGKRIEASRNTGQIGTIAFSPDGKRYAAICGAASAQFVVLDGKKGQEYFGVNPSLEFSADSSKLLYICSMVTPTAAQFLVVNDDESDAFYAQPRYWLSVDGKHLAVAGQLDAGGKQYFRVDGKPVTLPPRAIPTAVAFSPDGSRYALIAGGDAKNGPIYVDGKDTGLTGNFIFSPDSKQLAVAGYRTADSKRGIFINGEPVHENNGVRYRSFTPDSQHLLWVVAEPAKAADPASGSFEWVTYVDGVPAVRSERSTAADMLFGSVNQDYAADHPGWLVEDNGSLVVLGHTGDVAKRFRLKPDSSTSIATMVAEAKAAPARAAAKAAEEKKKADEAAAAKKAKADADAAEAAAKAKADYDAAVAKRKAEYDTAMAKRKADYDAALAKRKADYDAAVAARAEQLKQQQKK